MKRVIILGLVAAGVTLYSCHGPSNKSASGLPDSGYVSNSVQTPMTLAGKPVPKKTATTAKKASSKNAINVDKPSKSKGVGPFASAQLKLGAVNKAMAAKGKKLFDTYCTACHTISTQRLVGPGLKDITKKRTPEWILNMIVNPMEMTKKDPVAKALKKKLNGVQMTKMGLNNKQAKAVLAYLRQNDGVK